MSECFWNGKVCRDTETIFSFWRINCCDSNGVIASQPTPAQLKIVNSPTIQGESHQRVTLNPVTLNFAKPQMAATSDTAGNTVNKTHHASLVQTVTTPSTRTAQPKLTTPKPKSQIKVRLSKNKVLLHQLIKSHRAAKA